MDKTEHIAVYHALKENDGEVFDRLPFPQIFADHMLQNIWKLALKVKAERPVSFEAVHIQANKDGGPALEATHEALTQLEGEVFWYDETILDTIKENWRCRVYQNFGKKLLEAGTDKLPLAQADEEIEKMHSLVHDISSEKKLGMTLRDAMDDIINRKMESLSDYRLHVKNAICKKIFEWFRPKLYILAGLRSMGKSIVADRLTVDWITGGHKGFYISLDNTKMETAYTLVAMITGVSYDVIESGILDEWQRKQVENILPRVLDSVFIIDKRYPADRLIRLIKKLMESDEWKEARFCILDYVQKLPPRPRRKNDVEEKTEGAIALANGANDLGIPIIALSQSNDVSRDDKVKFTNNDLKGCKAWADEAFFVMGLEGEQGESLRTARVTKFKRGPVGSYDFEFNFVKKDLIEYIPRH